MFDKALYWPRALAGIVAIGSLLIWSAPVLAQDGDQLQLCVNTLAGAQPADPPGYTAQQRCMEKQLNHLESCNLLPPQEQATCQIVATTLIQVCQQMNPNVSSDVASSLFCNGICAIKQCPLGCQLPNGDVCLGNVCANPGTVCDPGVLWDCTCETTELGAPLFQTPQCSCGCQ